MNAVKSCLLENMGGRSGLLGGLSDFTFRLQLHDTLAEPIYLLGLRRRGRVPFRVGRRALFAILRYPVAKRGLTHPSSRAISAIGRPELRTNATASRLNSDDNRRRCSPIRTLFHPGPHGPVPGVQPRGEAQDAVAPLLGLSPFQTWGV